MNVPIHLAYQNIAILHRLILLISSLFVAVLAVAWLFNIQSAKAFVNCNNDAWIVSNETELNDAIDCFNAKQAGDYVITLSQDIDLITSTLPVSNSNPIGVKLFLDGDGYAINGQNLEGIRPLNITRDNTVVIQNLTIKGGYLDGGVFDNGGGIRNSGYLTITNSRIQENSTSGWGGGIYNNGALALISSYVISNSANAGGGMFNSNLVTFQDSIVRGNTGNSGGGIYSTKDIEVNDSEISHNTATPLGFYNYGGGIACNSHVTITNSIISNNISRWDGGIYSGKNTTIIDSHITDNASANRAGGIYSVGNIAIRRSTISGNMVTMGHGGGVYGDKNVDISDSVISENTSKGSGGGYGGGVYATEKITISNNTIISGNIATTGGGRCF